MYENIKNSKVKAITQCQSVLEPEGSKLKSEVSESL